MAEGVKEIVEICCTKRPSLVVGNTTFNSITDFQLSPKDMEKAYLELGETDEIRKDCLQKLKGMLLEDKNVRYRTDDQYLLRYLRVRKFDCKNAYNSIKKAYYHKKNRTDIFHIPSSLKSVLDTNFVTALPYTDKDGRIIFCADVGKWKPEEVPFENATGTISCISEIMSMNPKCQVNGLIAIWDVKELNISRFSHLFTRFPTCLTLLLYCYPWRVKHVFVMNAGPLTRLIYNSIRPLLTKKLKERFYLLGFDYSVLHEHINPEILPRKYGGKLEEEDCSISQLIFENIRYIEYERSFF